MKFMTEGKFEELCEGFKEFSPHGDIPNKFYLEFMTYLYLIGAADGGMDSNVFMEAIDQLSEGCKDEA